MMRIRRCSRACMIAVGISLATCMAAPVASAALVHVFETSVVQDVPAVLDASIGGIDMRDMEVSILRTDGETDSRVFGVSTVGRAVGVGWALNHQSGDTDTAAWSVNNSLSHAPILKIVLNGKPGRVMFDVDMFDSALGSACAQYAPSGGLPLSCSSGSGQGRRFSYDVGDFDATVTYSDPVGLAGLTPLGDLFYTMTIEFGRPGMGASSFSFFQDTDLAGRSAVPLPPTLSLFAAALAGLGAMGQSKRSSRRSASGSSGEYVSNGAQRRHIAPMRRPIST